MPQKHPSAAVKKSKPKIFDLKRQIVDRANLLCCKPVAFHNLDMPNAHSIERRSEGSRSIQRVKIFTPIRPKSTIGQLELDSSSLKSDLGANLVPSTKECFLKFGKYRNRFRARTEGCEVLVVDQMDGILVPEISKRSISQHSSNNSPARISPVQERVSRNSRAISVSSQ